MAVVVVAVEFKGGGGVDVGRDLAPLTDPDVLKFGRSMAPKAQLCSARTCQTYGGGGGGRAWPGLACTRTSGPWDGWVCARGESGEEPTFVPLLVPRPDCRHYAV